MIDPVLGGVILLFGAGVLLAAAQLHAGTATDPLGPRGFPTLIGIGLLGSGLTLLATSILSLRSRAHEDHEADEDSAEDENDGRALRTRLVMSCAVIIAYVLVLPIAGFLLSTPAFVAAMIVLQGGASRLAFVTAVIAFPIVVYLLFAVLLGISLPTGLFDPMVLLGVR